MSFSGDLEHIPLIDVIQLLQQSAKSGTLRLTGDRGSCQLGFREGFIVSANHVNTGYRIGSILVELGVITREALDLTLAEQALRVPHPPPLIALLVETGRVKREAAYRGLQTLIELTIVEVLTWTHGRFELDVDQILVSDEYRYFPDHHAPPPQVSTQSVLMEALRIFDEKKRDGTLNQPPPEGAPDAEETISADDLGLGDVESLRRRSPSAAAAAAPVTPRDDEHHRARVRKELERFPEEQQERLVDFLAAVGEPLGEEEAGADDGLTLAVILFTGDQLLNHTVATCCAARNFFVFATDEPQDLSHIIEQSLARDLTPLLVIDAPGEAAGPQAGANLDAVVRAIRESYPALRFIRFVDPGQDDLVLRELVAGALTAFVKPSRSAEPAAFVESFIAFTEALLACVQQAGAPPEHLHLRDFRERLVGLNSLAKPAEVALSVLQFAATLFPRALTLLVAGEELVVERTVGLGSGRAVAPALKVHLPLERPSVFATVVDTGVPFFGQASHERMLKLLHESIGEPHSTKIAIVPLATGAGRVVALTYGDFGAAWATPLPLELLDIFARHAGLVLGTLAQRPRT
jgi:hypothetical protein